MKDRIEGVGPGRLGSEGSQVLRKRNFERLSERRLQEAILAITRLSGLSSPYNYRYSRTEADQIIRELDQAMEALKEDFRSGLEDLDRMSNRRRMVAKKLKSVSQVKALDSKDELRQQDLLRKKRQGPNKRK